MAAVIHLIIRCQFSGVHYWPSAPQDHHEAYLVHPHRHVFHVEAALQVRNTEREVEFIALKEAVKEYCEENFAGPHTLSCEAMAHELVQKFGFVRCRVMEDNENGAEVIA